MTQKTSNKFKILLSIQSLSTGLTGLHIKLLQELAGNWEAMGFCCASIFAHKQKACLHYFANSLQAIDPAAWHLNGKSCCGAVGQIVIDLI